MSSHVRIGGILFLLLLIAIVFDSFWGWNGDRLILTVFRVPRVLSAIGVGAGLAVCGVLLQTLFHNPIVGPNVLGISSGASLGIAFGIMGSAAFGIQLSTWSLSLYGWIGALLISILVLIFSEKVRQHSSVLLFGVIISGVAGAGITLLQYLSPSVELKKYIYWSMGSLHDVSLMQSLVMLFITLLILSFFYFFAGKLDLMLLEHFEAINLGLDVKKVRFWAIAWVSIFVSIATVLVGSIAFVGLMVPHLARWMLKDYQHRKIIIISAILGALVVVVCDLLSSYLWKVIVPINVFTAVLAAPAIIYYLMYRHTDEV